MWQKNSVDKILLGSILALAAYGIVIFLSASLGLLANKGDIYTSVALNQIAFGLIGGGIACYIASNVPYTLWRKYSFWIFVGAGLLTLSVFIPVCNSIICFGSELAGAKRWIWIGPLSFQPSELLKIAYVIYAAAWLSIAKQHITTLQKGTMPFVIISCIAAGILILQPDNDTAFVMMIAGGAMYFVAGANWKHIVSVLFLGAVAITLIAMNRDYVAERIMTFINPAANPLTSGYQVQQSLIAIGSGGIFGRGLGQSVQKFNFLPEPIGDSIFAVASEEFGFVGSNILIILFMTFLIRSIKISVQAKETFGGLLILGLAILIVSQSFINMASMLGIFPLSGLPLLFVSHGGSALFFTLLASGIMLNISRSKKTN